MSRAGVDKQNQFDANALPSPSRSDGGLTPLDSKSSIFLLDDETKHCAAGLNSQTNETSSVNARKETSGLRDGSVNPEDQNLPRPSNGVSDEGKAAAADGSDSEESLPLVHVKKLKVPDPLFPFS